MKKMIALLCVVSLSLLAGCDWFKGSDAPAKPAELVEAKEAPATE